MRGGVLPMPRLITERIKELRRELNSQKRIANIWLALNTAPQQPTMSGGIKG
jgi:hypothetical protein